MLPAFGWQAAFAHWEFSPAVTAAAVAAAALYLWGVRRVARRHPARPWPRWRTGVFLGGVAVAVFATESGVGAYDDVLFWDHMIQHLLLIMVAPSLLVVGQPFTLLLHASRNPLHTWAKRLLRSRVASVLTWPPFVLAAYAVTIVATHLTGLVNVVLTNNIAHHGEHVLYLVVGFLFFLPVIGREPIRWRVSYPVRMVLLVLSMPVDTFTGVVLGYANRGFAVVGPRPPGAPSPVEDVHWGGAVMWIGGDAIMFAFMLIVYVMWARDSSSSSLGHGWLERARESSFDALVAANAPSAPAGPAGEPQSRGGDPADPADGGRRLPGRGVGSGRGIDDDEHLAAYNAYLARLNASENHDSRD